jgi:hypothetical protein
MNSLYIQIGGVKMENKKELYVWHILVGLVYLSLLVSAIYFLNAKGLIKNISVFDFVLISLAVFRLERLIVSDMIFDFVRDSLDKINGGLGLTLAQLVHCPWCVGVWTALFLGFIYFLSPLSWFFIFVLALAGTGTVIEKFAVLLIRIIDYFERKSL